MEASNEYLRRRALSARQSRGRKPDCIIIELRGSAPARERASCNGQQQQRQQSTDLAATTVSDRLVGVNRNPKPHRKARTVPSPPAAFRAIKGNKTTRSGRSANRGIFIIISNNLVALPPLLLLLCGIICWAPQLATSGGGVSSTSGGSGERMVRLCIASVDPIKLSSQCVMCNRREFPLTVIDCTGITRVNDLIASPLSVQEATCLIYNCRRQVPDIKPEQYHGSVSHAVSYRGGMGSGGAASNYHHLSLPSAGIAGLPVSGGGSAANIYEMIAPSGLFGGGYSMQPSQLAHQQQQHPIASASPFMTRFGLGYGVNPYQASPAATVLSPLASLVPKGLIGGPSLLPNRQQALPYALVPAPGFPFAIQLQKF